MERLIVKNFGPLKDVDIELNKINLFIGENGSGKSVLAKIITIILNLKNHTIDEKTLFKKFQEYYISFFTNETVIQFFIRETLSFEIRDKKINSMVMFNDLDPIIQYEIRKVQDRMISTTKLTTQYIPAERSLISLFNKSLSTLILEEVPLPKFLLRFSSEFEKAGNELKELEFLNVKYVNGDGLDRHKVYFNDENYLPLENSSSGIQSALPLYLTIKYFANRDHSIIIEEPEQNLFPKAQKETVEYIIKELGAKNKIFMMTHSPYILTALNNLILANDVKEQKGIEALKGIIEERYCVSFEEVSTYSLVDGKSINIMDKEDRIIGVNVIDSISDEVSETFDKLLAKLD